MLHEAFVSKRAELTRKYLPFGAGFLVLGGVLFFIYPFLGLVAGIGVLYIALYLTKLQAAASEFKDQLMTNVLAEFFTSVSHDKHKGLSLVDVMASELLSKPDRFYSNDLILGEYQGVDFRLSDVTLQRVTSNGKTTTVTTYFRGPVMVFDFHKDTDGKLIVQETMRGELFTKYKRIKLESVAFNKTFHTYSTKDQLAFYILTPHFMERLLRLEDEIGGNFYFSFIDGKMYVALYNNKDLFEVNMFGTINEKIYEQFYYEIKIVKDLIEELRLNPNL
jgi:hypothetical protein